MNSTWQVTKYSETCLIWKFISCNESCFLMIFVIQKTIYNAYPFGEIIENRNRNIERDKNMIWLDMAGHRAKQNMVGKLPPDQPKIKLKCVSNLGWFFFSWKCYFWHAVWMWRVFLMKYPQKKSNLWSHNQAFWGFNFGSTAWPRVFARKHGIGLVLGENFGFGGERWWCGWC